MNYQELITASIDRAIKIRIRREMRAVSKKAANNQHVNIEFTRKRRNAEDMLQARELGVSVEEMLA